MASWVEQLDARIAAEANKQGPKVGGTVEDGQTCPHCNDLHSWRMTFCQSCGCRLS